jgi:hypothetical protein
LASAAGARVAAAGAGLVAGPVAAPDVRAVVAADEPAVSRAAERVATQAVAGERPVLAGPAAFENRDERMARMAVPHLDDQAVPHLDDQAGRLDDRDARRPAYQACSRLADRDATPERRARDWDGQVV